jgi:hypothetical protein
MSSIPRLFVILGLGLPALACGSSASSPGGPSPTSTPTPAAHGATIQGTVETGFSTSGVAAVVHASFAGAGIRVSATGTSLSSTTDASGRFILAGVPGAKAELHFEAQGIDARLEVAGLGEDRSVNINVHVAGSQALLAQSDDKGAEAALRGATLVLGRGTAAASLRDFRVGDSVEVEGAAQADGSVYARKVKREDGAENEPPESEVGFKGAIQGLHPFVVAGHTIVTSGNTRILDKDNSPIAFSALKVGQRVEVEGTTQANGSVLAKKIKLDD